MKVSVTQEDIDKGSRHSSESCPLALALTRAFGKPVGVGLTRYGLVGTGARGYWLQLLPPTAELFRMRFDLGFRTQEPFEFEVSDEI